ncbi:MAG: hypothetical protein IKZ09_10945, partial [Clostridia bacterium]|nr:hypothetical protein [Clostridia bacterium]
NADINVTRSPSGDVSIDGIFLHMELLSASDVSGGELCLISEYVYGTQFSIRTAFRHLRIC